MLFLTVVREAQDVLTAEVGHILNICCKLVFVHKQTRMQHCIFRKGTILPTFELNNCHKGVQLSIKIFTRFYSNKFEEIEGRSRVFQLLLQFLI